MIRTETGTAEQLMDLSQGSADLGYLPDRRTAFIAMMMDDTPVAYRLD